MKKILAGGLLLAALLGGGCVIPMDFEVPIWSFFVKNDTQKIPLDSPAPAVTPASDAAPDGQGATSQPVVTAVPAYRSPDANS